MNIFLLLFFCDALSHGACGLPALTWSELLLAHHQANYMMSPWFCPCLILYLRHCGVIHPYIILLWFYIESFDITTVSNTSIITALLHIWAISHYASFLGQYSTKWLLSVFWLLQAGLKGTAQLSLVYA